MDDPTPNPVKGNPSIHSALLAAVGGYVAYLGYQILKGAIDGEGSMSFALAVVLAVFFALCGLATIAYAAVIWKRSQKDANKAAKDDAAEAPEDDSDEEPHA